MRNTLTSSPIPQQSARSSWFTNRADRQLLLCLLILTGCVLVSVAPLQRMAGTTELLALPTNPLLTAFGSWLPTNLHLAHDAFGSHMSSQVIFFLILVTLEFACYLLAAWLLQQRTNAVGQQRTMQLIWLGAIGVGLIFVLTPAMLSHDAYAYAAYGRLLVVHHANPYFVTIAAYPHDPFMRLDDWRDTVAAYGPFWLMLNALIALGAQGQPLAYVLTYRLLNLAAHLLNVWLVYNILRRMGRSPRAVAVGTLLYAWNPLVLQESCLGGHIDIGMVTWILLGLYWCIRAEQARMLHTVRGALPPMIALTLAMLTKFTAAPMIVLLLVLLARKTLAPDDSLLRHPRVWHWSAALRLLAAAIGISAGLTGICYAVFWLGHSPTEILRSFTAQPSASGEYGSILEAIHKWTRLYGFPGPPWLAALLRVFSSYSTWQGIKIAVAVILMLAGMLWQWRVPTTRTLALATLALLAGLLIVTPWFFPWYVTWIVGLAAPGLPYQHERVPRALLAFTLAFSASAHCIYLFAHNWAPLGTWIGLTCLTTVIPPLVALLAFLILPTGKKARLGVGGNHHRR